MYYNVNLLAILAASIGSFILGWVWYSPKVFGTVYRKLQKNMYEGQTPEETKKHMIRGSLVMILAGLVQAAVLYFLVLITRAGSVSQLMTISFLTWAGFSLSGIAVDTFWKGLSPKLIIIDGFFGLFSNVLMMFILILIL
jgi:hypothetical protein